MRTRSILFMSFIFLALSAVPLLAQSADCTALITGALADFGKACGDSRGGSACFGGAASATFLTDSAGSAFAAPGDQVPLSVVQSVSTQPLDADNGAWGLALLNVHGNVPLALSDRGLSYVLMGEVQVENAVPVENAFIPVEPVVVKSLVPANLRVQPNTDARVMANAPVGTELAADGLSSDAQWLRVFTGETTLWISRQVVGVVSGEISGLPTVSASTRTLMQSFYLNTGSEPPNCTGAPPSVLVVQAPDGIIGVINVNGAEIRIASSIALAVFNNQLHLFVLNGGANTGGVSVPTGFTIHINLTPDGRSTTGAWTGLRPISEGERGLLMPLQNISPELLHYVLQVPTQAQVAAILAQINSAVGGQTIAGPAAGRANCTRFRPTSPLDAMPFGLVNFYWDGAPGATSYRLNIYDSGARVGVFEVSSLSTTAAVDTGGLGGSSNYTWDVEALVDGQTACTTGRVSVLRGAGAQVVTDGGGSGAAPPPPPPTCTWGC